MNLIDLALARHFNLEETQRVQSFQSMVKDKSAEMKAVDLQIFRDLFPSVSICKNLHNHRQRSSRWIPVLVL